MRSIPLSAALLPSLCLLACGDDSPPGPTPGPDGGRLDIVVTRPAAAPIAPATECTVTTAREPAGAAHVAPCTDIAYPSIPPSGGTHFSQWADFKTYGEPVPYGFLVHSLEHGAVALLHNCPNGCPEVLAAFERISAATTDPMCTAPRRNRVIVAPAPDMDVAVAAVAWERVYLATCLDEASLSAFVSMHYARAPENFCAPGRDVPPGGWCAPSADAGAAGADAQASAGDADARAGDAS